MNNENDKVCMVHPIYRICWSAIFAGAFVGMGLAFLLHLYGVAISLSAFSSMQDGASVIAIGGALGMLFGVIVAMATAGFVAGHLGRFHYNRVHGGVIYGFITWTLILLMSAVIAGPIMNYAAVYGNSLSRSVNVEAVTVNVSSDSTANDLTAPVIKHSDNTKQPVAVVNTTQLAWSGWLVFLLFFVGAISSCVGATCAMHCKRDEELDTPK